MKIKCQMCEVVYENIDSKYKDCYICSICSNILQNCDIKTIEQFDLIRKSYHKPTS